MSNNPNDNVTYFRGTSTYVVAIIFIVYNAKYNTSKTSGL